jgi:hypothetical protein
LVNAANGVPNNGLVATPGATRQDAETGSVPFERAETVEAPIRRFEAGTSTR